MGNAHEDVGANWQDGAHGQGEGQKAKRRASAYLQVLEPPALLELQEPVRLLGLGPAHGPDLLEAVAHDVNVVDVEKGELTIGVVA